MHDIGAVYKETRYNVDKYYRRVGLSWD